MKKIILIILIIFNMMSISAQTYVGSVTTPRFNSHGNLLFNGGFESHDGSGFPTAIAQANQLASWEDRKFEDQGVPLHSPDWMINGLYTVFFPNPTALSGKGMLGLGPYELIQQNFRNEDMKEGELYIVSMYIYLNSNFPPTHSSLNVYLGNHHFEYKSENDEDMKCEEDYVDYKTNQRILISSWDIDPSIYPSANGWVKISQVFRAPANHNFWDYFMIDIRQNDYDPSGAGNHCEDGYLYIDEVALEEVDQCGKACSPSDLGPIQYTTVPNAMITNSIGFTMLIKDALGINFTVFDSGGLEIYNQNAYDPNGLIDVGYSDYYFSWTGQKPDGSLFPEDVYVYQLRMWNCDYETDEDDFTNSLTYIVGTGFAIQGFDFHNTSLIDCCPDYLEIQDKEYFSGLTVEKADISITAGENFTTSFPVGPVILHNGSDVKYVSNTINILPGFSVEAGAEYHAISTTNCPEAYVRTANPIRERTEIKDMKSTFENALFSITPNPSSDGLFKIISETENSQIENISVHNSLGEIIHSNNSITSSLVIDLSNYSNGIYFLKVKLKNNPNAIIKKLICNK